MATLSPSNLETADYGTSGWNNIYSSNFQKLNDYLAKFEDLWNSTPDNWNILRYDSSTSKWIKDTIANLSTQLESSLAKVDLSNVDDNTILTKLKNVDGSGSGLDSDTVDGFHADISPAPLTIPVADSSGYINDWINQGAGSGLDADTVDGKHASDFVPVSSDSAINASISGNQWLSVATSGIVSLPSQSICILYQATQQTISSDTDTKVILNAKLLDTQNEGDTTNYRITVSEDGIYLLVGQVGWYGADVVADKIITTNIKVNGNLKVWTSNHTSRSRAIDCITITLQQLSAGDYVELYAKQTFEVDARVDNSLTHTFLIVAKIA